VVTHSGAGPVIDADHPIPNLDTLDVHVNTDKGAYVGIVTARPLKDDEISRARLQRKIEVALSFFNSEEYRELHGAPCRTRSRLWINVHSGSDAAMLTLVEHYRTQIEANDVTAVVKLIGTN
jgi:hypothetical protein